MSAPQDWETAASFWRRAGKIPQEIMHGEFGEEILPSAEIPDLPSVTLESVAESLYGLFLRESEHAAEAAEEEKITRFFKLRSARCLLFPRGFSRFLSNFLAHSQHRGKFWQINAQPAVPSSSAEATDAP